MSHQSVYHVKCMIISVATFISVLLLPDNKQLNNHTAQRWREQHWSRKLSVCPSIFLFHCVWKTRLFLSCSARLCHKQNPFICTHLLKRRQEEWCSSNLTEMRLSAVYWPALLDGSEVARQDNARSIWQFRSTNSSHPQSSDTRNQKHKSVCRQM